MAATVRIQGLTLDGVRVKCADDPGRAPVALRLIPSGPNVMATCGRKHGASRIGIGGKQCFFTLPKVTAQALGAIASQAKPGKIGVQLPGGGRLDGKLLEVGDGGKGKAAASSAKFAEAQGKKSADQRGRAPSGGGTAKAAFGALTAGFGAVSAVAGAVGQTAGAAGQAVAATAGAAGKFADTATATVKAVDNTAARSFAKNNRKP